MSGYRLLLATTVLVGLVCTTHAQDPALRAEVQRWHERLFGSKTAVSVADGRQAREQIARWNLDRKTLDAEVRGELLRLEIIAALAIGDAGYAVKHAAELGREFPALQSTRRATWLAAVAAGDAALARQTLEQLKEGGATKDKAIAVRLARLQRVGHAAPDRTVTTAGGPPMALRQRQGVVLLIDFWSVREPPADRQVEALRQLVATYKAEGQVAFLGVNTDAAEDVEAARKLAADKGYTWPQFYEQSTGAGTLAAAFGVETLPWDVIIDGAGNVRAVGAAFEPEFQYALRAAFAEAKKEYPALAPRTVDGQVAPGPNGESAREASEKNEEQVAPEPEPPHDPEAARLLDQARLYLKTGKKTEAKKLLQELIEKYPHTWEAREARRLGLI